MRGCPAETQRDPRVVQYPAAKRVVAIGDLHGDMEKARRAFRLGGLIDAGDRWVGGETVAVQVGDQLDRGPDEVPLLYFLERLQREAQQAGGRLHVLNGNHETMNAAGDTRYAHRGASVDFAHWHEWMRLGDRLIARCEAYAGAGRGEPLSVGEGGAGNAGAQQGHEQDTRGAALAAGGPLSRRFFSTQPMVLQLGETVFAHGGVHPEHVRFGLARLNGEVAQWLRRGERHQAATKHVRGRDTVVWSRQFSHEDGARCDCDMLKESLQMLDAKRMVVGHTIQSSGINQACEGQVLRVDVGMSAGCGGAEPQVLEIVGDKNVRVLRERKGSAMGA